MLYAFKITIMKVWILFSVANDYNQPDKAFEKIYWEEPTKEERERVKEMNNYGGEYWIEEFTK
tara:strand:- start:356 stop:544 length:189 start_codon:yes stop_codon:yes gene_type:complete